MDCPTRLHPVPQADRLCSCGSARTCRPGLALSGPRRVGLGWAQSRRAAALDAQASCTVAALPPQHPQSSRPRPRTTAAAAQPPAPPAPPLLKPLLSCFASCSAALSAAPPQHYVDYSLLKKLIKDVRAAQVGAGRGRADRTAPACKAWTAAHRCCRPPTTHACLQESAGQGPELARLLDARKAIFQARRSCLGSALMLGCCGLHACLPACLVDYSCATAPPPPCL